MLYAIPVFGWIIGLFFDTCLAIPFYYLWNWLGPLYFDFLPEKYLHLDFWTIVGLFIVISILKFKLLPRFAELPSKGDK